VRTGIVLAGGRSARFGGDKLAAELDGRSLLRSAVDAVAPLVDGVLVAVARLPEEFLQADVPVALIHDRDPFAGPLAGLANALDTAVDPDPATDLAIVVGGDMPRLVPAVLRSMLERLAGDPTIDAVLLGRPPSIVDPEDPPPRAVPPRRAVLPLAVRVRAAAKAAADAIDSGDRSLQAMVERLAHVELPPAVWLPLDPGATTLLDVDTAADLERIRGG
jgi:molybdopterin-guanine dinucleotide biosynthesis protein A